MPQKKNPDMAELIRGKTGRVYGDLMGMLTVMKGLPLAYNKDMQEDKEGVFDATDTIKMCVPVFTNMIKTAVFKTDNMYNAAKGGFTNATDAADWLGAKHGRSFQRCPCNTRSACALLHKQQYFAWRIYHLMNSKQYQPCF